jgi:carbonic anhydrase
MINLAKFLIVVGIMIAIGAMLLIFGSQTITGDLVIEEGRINSSTELRIIAELDPDINTQGVYAIQTIEGKEYDISAIVLDPSNVKIRNVSVDRNSFEDNFEIDSSGTYTLIINTPDPEDIGVVGGIGHVPDSTGVTISIIGFFMIVLGMAGVMVIGFMIIRQRKKKSS